MKFPILKNKSANHHNCITCKKKLKSDFYVFNAGALKQITKDHQIMDKDLKGFCYINAHLDNELLYETLSVAESTPMGQFEIYTCSIQCMRKFFEKVFDEFSNKCLKKLEGK